MQRRPVPSRHSRVPHHFSTVVDLTARDRTAAEHSGGNTIPRRPPPSNNNDRAPQFTIHDSLRDERTSYASQSGQRANQSATAASMTRNAAAQSSWPPLSARVNQSRPAVRQNVGRRGTFSKKVDDAVAEMDDAVGMFAERYAGMDQRHAGLAERYAGLGERHGELGERYAELGKTYAGLGVARRRELLR